MNLKRIAAGSLRRLLAWYPVVVITGPRQAGKTTLVRHTLPDWPYVSLEDPDARAFATADPRGFLGQFPDGAIFDEAQRAPDLFSYLQTRVDASGRMGQFVLTGSQQPGLHDRVSQSLAGRAGFLTLLPFSWAEVQASHGELALEDVLTRGLYPPLYARSVPPHVWFSDYVATYVERDVRQLIHVRDLVTFNRFVQLCATRTAQTLNLSSLAADCGIAHNTALAWIGVLEACHIVVRVPPFHSNLGKRITKAPKLYFLDAGLAGWLAGVRDREQLVSGPLRGPLFETFVVSELIKRTHNHLGAERLFHWRTGAGHEVDVILETASGRYAVEIKSGRTVATDWFKALDTFRALSPGTRARLVYGGETSEHRSTAAVVGWRSVSTEVGDPLGDSPGP